MKQLIPLVLVCGLLCGCAGPAPSEEPVAATEAVSQTLPPPKEDDGGSVQTIPLNLSQVRGIFVFNGQLLLLSGRDSTDLTLMDPRSGQITCAASLDFLTDPEDPSLVFHPDGTMSCFDSSRSETLVLDSSLQPLRTIPAPVGFLGAPILSPKGNTLFYCTATRIKAWDLESGIHRCIAELPVGAHRLTAVHMDGTILQCRTGSDETLFLQTEDGNLLHRTRDEIRLTTLDTRYYARIPAGTYQVPIFGSLTQEPKMAASTPEQVFFLPQSHAAVAAFLREDQRVRLEYHDLSREICSAELLLNRFLLPKSVAALSRDTLAILTYDPQKDRDFLTLWDISAETGEDLSTVPYRSAEDPDTAGLARCREQAEALGRQYGITILLGEDAVQAAPRHCVLTAEHLIPILESELHLLEQRLANFPTEMIRQTAGHFSGLTLCLVRSLDCTEEYPAADIGIQFLEDSHAYVVIPTGNRGEQALYHQLFHLMEVHIFSRSNAFDSWDLCNPAGFRYDYDYSANAGRDSGVYLFAESRAFVDTFSMSYPREDRAVILEYAMLRGQEALFQPDAMQQKLRILCTGIRDAFGLKDPNERFLWEQYLE